MRVTSEQEDKQTWENCVWVAEKQKKIETLKGSGGLKTYLLVWEIIVSNRKNGNHFVITEKNEPNQKSTKIVFNKNAKMVTKSLNTEGNSLKPFKCYFSDG